MMVLSFMLRLNHHVSIKVENDSSQNATCP
jgi:hypothetical protein